MIWGMAEGNFPSPSKKKIFYLAFASLLVMFKNNAIVAVKYCQVLDTALRAEPTNYDPVIEINFQILVFLFPVINRQGNFT